MQYNRFDKDFVKRTISLIDSLSDSTEYEVTLLINCLFGLIVIPTENNYKGYKRYERYCVEQLRECSYIPKERSNEQLVKCMKNALSHLHIEIATENNKISRVKFRDKKPKENEYHTEIVFDVLKLKKYALDVARYYLLLLER